MKEEFSLSNYLYKNGVTEAVNKAPLKEFIRLLKEDLKINLVQVPHILNLELRWIDKLAGEKLI